MPPETEDRNDNVLDTGLEFRPGDAICVRVVHRDQRTLITDSGSAIDGAAAPRGWQEVAHRLSAELDVNISRHGVVSLPVVRVGPSEAEVTRRIAEASHAFYQELLELDQQGSFPERRTHDGAPIRRRASDSRPREDHDADEVPTDR